MLSMEIYLILGEFITDIYTDPVLRDKSISKQSLASIENDENFYSTQNYPKFDLQSKVSSDTLHSNSEIVTTQINRDISCRNEEPPPATRDISCQNSGIYYASVVVPVWPGLKQSRLSNAAVVKSKKIPNPRPRPGVIPVNQSSADLKHNPADKTLLITNNKKNKESSDARQQRGRLLSKQRSYSDSLLSSSLMTTGASKSSDSSSPNTTKCSARSSLKESSRVL